MFVSQDTHVDTLELIPVIDLMGGRAVHADGARNRLDYRALHTSLCPSSDPLVVADSFLALHPFRTFYIADLDCITGAGNNFAVIRRLRSHHPELQLWIDAGIRHQDDYHRLKENDLGVVVVGSETLRDKLLLDKIATGRASDVVLSLDFRGPTFLGPPGLESRPDLWPQRLIVMALARIAGTRGPALRTLTRTVAHACSRAVFAAGGVRDNADLQRLQAAGASGALLATALHSGRLDSSHLTAYR